MIHVYSCWFGDARFRAMAHALRVSIREHTPGANMLIEQIESPRILNTYHSNTVKLAQWVRITDGAPEGAKLVLIDGDCLARESLAPAFDSDFDIAVTAKEAKRLRVNAGVVFLRISDRTRAFMRQWLAVNNAMLADRALHQPNEIKYGGINQAALGLIRERPLPDGMTLIELPAARWNACHDPLWSQWPQAAVIHYKSALRRALWQGLAPPQYRALVDLHRDYQRKANL